MFEIISPPIFWVILIILFAAIESITLGLTSLWFAFGALVGLIASLFNLNIYIQIAAFIAVSAVMLVYTRPIAREYLKIGKVKTNTEGLIGEEGIVVQDIERFKTGQIKVRGQIWTAKEIEGHEVNVGSFVEVLEIEGVKLIVRKIEGGNK
jgi:membrane protein implicated in regulation of membrane protease activity